MKFASSKDRTEPTLVVARSSILISHAAQCERIPGAGGKLFSLAVGVGFRREQLLGWLVGSTTSSKKGARS
jgi:hypothetical protein